MVQITPLQLARAFVVFANGGWQATVHFVAGDIDCMSLSISPALGMTRTAEDSTKGTDHSGFGCFVPYPEGKNLVVAFA